MTADQYANFSFGTFEGNASSKITVQALGGGYGLTDKVTMYGFIPFYYAQVDMQIIRTKKGRANSGTLVEIDNLPNVDTRLIQSLIVNYFGYKPLGTWKATNFGDGELGMLYQIKKWKDSGLLMKAGVVVPTGRVDDPDTLQDIAFGDGQWDYFFEFGGGKTFTTHWSADGWTRLVYQAPYEANLRLPDSAVFPVTTRKGMTKIKLGNKSETNLKGNFAFNDQWSTSLCYTFEYKEADRYTSAYSDANHILALDTEKIAHTAKLNVNYSTVQLYKTKKFIAPINLNLSLQSIIKGKNIPRYERVDFDFSLYF